PAVRLGWRSLDQMTDAPGNGDARTAVAAGTALPGTEHSSNILALRRLLAQIDPHAPASLRLAWRYLEAGRQHADRARGRQQRSRRAVPPASSELALSAAAGVED